MKNHKSLFINRFFFVISALLAVGAGIFIYSYFFSKPAIASWFDESWLYRKAITVTVTSSASDITDLETLVTLDTSTSGKFQSSCQDLRFTNTGGKPLPYYIDSGCGTSSTKVWVMVDLVPKNTTTYNMYMYYGNPSATAASDSTRFKLFNGLVGYWTMNESSWAGVAGEVKDSSINGNHGQAVGTPPTTSAAKYSNGGSFNGVIDYVNLGTTGYGISGDTTMTLSAWFKTNSVSDQQTIAVFGDTTTLHNFALYLNANGNGSIQAAFNGGNNYSSASGVYSAGQWYHFVATKTPGAINSTTKVYLNGVEINSATSSTATPNITISLAYIGMWSNGNLSKFNGQIDDVRIYNRALSASEISLLYNNPGNIASYGTAISQPTTSAGSEEQGPGPVGYWKFDDGQGTTAQDSSSSNNDGTITGATWITEDQCVSGKCLKFDGNNDYVDIPDLTNNTVSVEMWLKYQANSPWSQYMIVDGQATNVFSLLIDATTKMVVFGTYDGTLDTLSGGVLDENTWYHVAITYNNGAKNIYVNGILKGSSTRASSNPVIKAFGMNTDEGATYYWPLKGSLDQVRIFNYVRTAAQIKADYNSRGASKGTSVQIGPQSKALSDGLVGYWKMDETSGTLADSSGNSNTGTWNGTGSSHYTAGKFGNGGGFNGTDDYVDAGNSSILGPTNLITVSAWVNPSSGFTTDWRDAVAKAAGAEAANRQYQLRTDNSTAKASFHIWHSGGDLSAVGTTTLAAGTWYHLVGVYDGSATKIYVNGVLEGLTTGTVTINTTSGILAIGKLGSYVGSENWKGNLDEVRIYNRALSPKEVSDLYNFAPGPVVHLKMDENKGTSANDTSGNSRTGTLNGNPLWAPGKYGAGVKLDGTGDNVSVSDFSY